MADDQVEIEVAPCDMDDTNANIVKEENANTAPIVEKTQEPSTEEKPKKKVWTPKPDVSWSIHIGTGLPISLSLFVK